MSPKLQSESFGADWKATQAEAGGGACKLHEGFIDADDGARLFVRSWTPRGPILADVVLTHGLGEHSARYFHVGEFFAAQGFRLCAYDQRGHGRSDGSRGDVASYDVLLDDLARVAGHCATDGVPRFFYGHSFGAQVVLNFIVGRNPAARGVILTSPLLELVFQPSCWKVWLARLTLKVFPSFTQTTGMLDAGLSRDAVFLQTLRDHKLMHRRMSARLYVEMTDGAGRAVEAASRFRAPLLLIHGGDDPVTSMPASRRFFKRALSADKTLRIFPGMLHETHNEFGRDTVLAEMTRWMCERTRNPPPTDRMSSRP